MANKTLWRDEFLWDVYELAKDGEKEAAIAKILGVSLPTFLLWERKKPLFAMALQRGRALWKRKKSKHANDMEEYVYNRLSADEKVAWKRIMKAQKAKRGVEIINAILEGRGKLFRQHLFIHAMIHGMFSVTGACRKVGISFNTFEKWRTEDPEFAKLFKVVQEAKKDKVEHSYFRLVEAGEANPVLHGLKTLCGDRGYKEKQEVDVNVSGTVQHTFVHVDVDKLPLSARIAILSELRRTKQIESQPIEPIPPLLESAVSQSATTVTGA